MSSAFNPVTSESTGSGCEIGKHTEEWSFGHMRADKRQLVWDFFFLFVRLLHHPQVHKILVSIVHKIIQPPVIHRLPHRSRQQSSSEYQCSGQDMWFVPVSLDGAILDSPGRS